MSAPRDEVTTSVEVETVRELYDFRGQAVLVRSGHDHFIVSSVDAYSGFETLVFPADSSGGIVDWCEIAGGRGMDRGAAIHDLARVLEAGS